MAGLAAVKQSHLSNDVLKKYRPTSAYLNARDYPTYKAEGEKIISEKDALVNTSVYSEAEVSPPVEEGGD